MHQAFSVLLRVLPLGFLLGCGSTHVVSSNTDASAKDAVSEAASDSMMEAGCPALVASSPDSGRKPGEEPRQHRSSASACPRVRAPVTPKPLCGGSPCRIDMCVSDSECTAGKNGRCEFLEFNGGPRVCSYDACFDDSDCDGGVCECRPSSASGLPNVCYAKGSPDSCGVDSECGPGGFCSPSLLATGDGFCSCGSTDQSLCADSGSECFESVDGGPPKKVPCLCGNVCGPPGYYCHTACDTCVNDSDCGDGKCLYDILNHVWDCQHPACTGP
jgi:hypothetical protein